MFFCTSLWLLSHFLLKVLLQLLQRLILLGSFKGELFLRSKNERVLLSKTKREEYQKQWKATNFMPIIGALISDSFLGRFLTIGLGSIFSFLGMFLLWLTAMIPQARPGPCDSQIQACKIASPSQYFLLFLSFALIYAGGIRPCSLAFGADQIDNRENSKNKRVLESYFGWYYASAALSVVIALTGIVYIQMDVDGKSGSQFLQF